MAALNISFSDTTIVIPTYNEAGNIRELIGELTKFRGISIIVADDGSKDRTQEIVRELHKRNSRITLLDRSEMLPHGLTASVIDGVKNVKTEFFIAMDGDLQHPPEKIPEIVGDLRAAYDAVLCKREKVAVEWALHRRIISKIATLLARARLGRRISDPLSGFFGAKTELFLSVLSKNEGKFEKKGYKVLFDFLKYAPRGMRIKEEPYVFGIRKKGSSKIGTKQIVSFLKAVFK